MARVNIHDRSTLERAYPADDFTHDAARNETTDALVEVGFDPELLERPGGWWAT